MISEKKKGDVINFAIITHSHEFRNSLKRILSCKDKYALIEDNFFLQDPVNVKIDLVIVCCEGDRHGNIALVKKLKEDYPGLSILAIAENNALQYIHDLCNTGIDGFLLINELHNLHEAVCTILSGKRYMNQTLLNCLLQNVLAKASDTYNDHCAMFNLKEHQVFQLMDAGYSEDVIAKTLDISPDKVVLYKNRLNTKTRTMGQMR
jgi:DNA-binding NarL/FixJ family response regulator